MRRGHGAGTEPPGHGANRAVITVVPGSLRTDLHPMMLPDGTAQYIFNCNTDRGVWELDFRYRQFNPAPASGGLGMGYGYYQAKEELMLFHSTQCYIYDVDANAPHSHVGTGDASVTTGSNGSYTSTTNDWYVWQAGKYLFGANVDAGVRFREIGDSTATNIYGKTTLAIPKPTAPTSGGAWNMNGNMPMWFERQPNKSMPFGTSSTAAATTVSVTGTGTNNTNQNNPNRIVIQHTTAALVHEKLTTAITFGGSIVWGDNAARYFHMMFKAGDECTLKAATEEGKPPVVLRLMKTSTSTSREIYPVAWEFVGGLETGDQNRLIAMFDAGEIDIWKAREVNKVEVDLYMGIGVDDEYYIYAPIMAGAPILKKENGSLSSNVTLAWAYKVGDNYGPLCDPVVLTGQDIQGIQPFTSFATDRFPDGGAVVRFSPIVPVAASLPAGVTTSDSIGVFRRLANGRWTLIYSSVISDFYTAGVPWDISTAASNTHEYIAGSYTSTLKVKRSEVEEMSYATAQSSWWVGNAVMSVYGTNVTAGCYWKNSNIVAKTNGYVYFSRKNNSFEFYWDDLSDVKSLDAEDLGQPKTIQATSNESPIIAFVPRNALYMFSKREAFAMFGDAPFLSSPPFAAPMAYGVVGMHAACAWQDGAIYGNEVGAFFLRATPGATKEAVSWQHEEITKKVGPTYRDSLLTSDRTKWTKLVIVAHAEELWLFCENRYLHLTKNGSWIYGEWADATCLVKAAWADPNRGIMFQTESGKLMMIGDYDTDGGTALNGSNGTEARWSYKTRTVKGPVAVYRARVRWTDQPTGLNIKAHTSNTTSPTGINFTSGEYQAFKQNETLPGAWTYLEISGGASDKLAGLDVEMSAAHTGVM